MPVPAGVRLLAVALAVRRRYRPGMRSLAMWVLVVTGCAASLEEAHELVLCDDNLADLPGEVCHAACQSIALESETCEARDPRSGKVERCSSREWRGLDGCCLSGRPPEQPSFYFSPCE